MNTAEIIEKKLRDAFQPAKLQVIDDSEAHRGHSGYREGGGTHFNVVIAAAAFNGQGRVQRQRAIHKVLAEELAGPVHALSLQVEGA